VRRHSPIRAAQAHWAHELGPWISKDGTQGECSRVAGGCGCDSRADPQRTFCHDQQRGRGPFASSRRGPRMGRSDGAVRSRIRAGHQWHVDDLATSWGSPLGSRGLTESGWLAPCSPGLGESPMRKSPVRPESLTGLTFNHGGRGGNRTSDTGIFTLVATRQCPLLAESGHRHSAQSNWGCLHTSPRDYFRLEHRGPLQSVAEQGSVRTRNRRRNGARHVAGAGACLRQPGAVASEGRK
jgi:hypothetical protein